MPDKPARDAKGRILPKNPKPETPALPPGASTNSTGADAPPETGVSEIMDMAPAAPVEVDEFPGRCRAEAEDGRRCLYAEHDPSFDHLFDEPKAKAPTLFEPPASAKPRKENDRAWWCGKCDNSQPLNMLNCGRCGTPRA